MFPIANTKVTTAIVRMVASLLFGNDNTFVFNVHLSLSRAVSILRQSLFLFCLSARMLQECGSFFFFSFVSIFNILLLFYLFFSILLEVNAAARNCTTCFAHFALLASHLFFLC
ncbi:hypothetical protein GHT06_009216 [Daphnia sinensis]|uniref:Uncharacterized protein n=1 Tax=Daphnia sinensis TaxID=1820382 RepID=A0AAD5Q2W6_9CRUS|nr:hypothetical protein GHT06_009216 [Daphnia sinensis]